MRNMKKFLALVLAMLMMFSVTVISTGAASNDADYTDAAQHLAALKILKGDEKGNLNLDNGVTRWQAALFFVQALTGKTDAKIWNADKSVYFNDVPEYGTAIDYAYGINVIVGRGNGVYGYGDAITYQDMLVMAVRALGYETENMVYPQGYTIAAQKLGLTDNISVAKSFKETLTRGETAQIIWDMLQTEVAYTDPLSGELVYPSETGALELIVNAGKDAAEWITIERTTLLAESGFSDAELNGVITEYVDADEDENDYNEDMVVISLDETDIIVKAVDVGISNSTKPSYYLGLPVTLHVDCAAADFVEKYEEEDATIVFVDYEDYDVVENLGSTENIKVVVNEKNADKTYVSLGGTKFTNAKYAVVLKVWDDEEGWTVADDQTWNNAFASFVYDDGNYIGDDDENPYANYATDFNTYGKVAYRVTDEVNDDEKTVVEVLYTPYTFGQYNVLELKDASTSKKTEFATYTVGFGEKMYLFGTDKAVTEDTSSVSKTNGKYAKAVTVKGEEVESGDFMFYNYNKADNVLTVAQNCGSYQTGRLTGYSDSKETAKIDGTSRTFGFKGLYNAANETVYNKNVVTGYIDALEKGKDNVKFLEVDGRIVYLAEVDKDTESKVGTYDFVIASVDPEIVAPLLDLTVEQYEDELSSGLYIDNKNNVAIAVLDKDTGAWKLASLKALAISYDVEDEDFSDDVDIANLATFAEMGVLNEAKQEKFETAAAALKNGVFALVSEKGGVYTLGAATNIDDYFAPFATSVAEDGVIFNATGRTNRLTKPGTEDKTRVTLSKNSVVVALFADGEIGVRVGVTKSDSNNKYDVAGGENSKFLAVSSDLIVIVSEKTVEEALALDLDIWSSTSAGKLTNYYIVLPDHELSYDVDDNELLYTIHNVFDARNKTVVAITTKTDISDVESGDVLYLNSIGSIESIDSAKSASIFGDAGTTLTYLNAVQSVFFKATTLHEADVIKSEIKFVDGETMYIASGSDVKVNVTKALTQIAGHAINVNYFGEYDGGENYGLMQDDYDFTRMVLATPIARYEDDGETETEAYETYLNSDVTLIEAPSVDGDDNEYYYVSYALSDEIYEAFSEPTEGVFDQFMIDHSGAELLVPLVDAEDGDYTNAASVKVVTTCATYVSGSTVKLVVCNSLVDADVETK